MNRALMTTFWRQRFTSPVRLLLLFTFWGFTVLFCFLRRPVVVPDSGSTVLFTLILGAGVIGRDLSTGVLQLILSRPVSRLEYVFSRWVALGTAAFAVAFLGWIVVLPFSLQAGTTASEALGPLVESYLIAYGLAAVITAFSTLVVGFGDLALWVVGQILAFALASYARLADQGWVGRVASEIDATLSPSVPLHTLMAGGTFHFYPVVTWVSTVTLMLLLGVFVMNRREFSYGTAG